MLFFSLLSLFVLTFSLVTRRSSFVSFLFVFIVAGVVLPRGLILAFEINKDAF